MKSLLKNNSFEKYYNYLISENEKFNLTAITDKNEVYEKHFLDSIQAGGLLESGNSVLDIGAGAGFPSIPLAIIRNDVKFTLIDSLQKRINFLNKLCTILNLKNVECYHSRIEDFAAKNKEAYNYVVARAVAPLPTLLEYCSQFLVLGGKLVAYKGSNYLEELSNSQNALNILGLRLTQTIKYTLQNANQERVLLVFTKIKPTPCKYPRKQNKPRLNPL